MLKCHVNEVRIDMGILRVRKCDVTLLMAVGTVCIAAMYSSSKNDADKQTASCPLLPTAILHIELHNMAVSFKVHHMATVR